MKSSGIGGQAVLEGVMMKNKNCYAVAVRKPNNEIEVKKEEFGAGERRTLFKVPIFRGMATFVESLVLGMHALTYSSSFYEEEGEQKEVSKAKEALVDVGVVALSVLMAVVVFILFPLFISSMLGRVIKSETLQLVMEGFLRLFMFIAYIALISRLNDIKRVFMYHGAEHKCINCVEQGYALTIANVKKQSKCHKRCGTSFMLVVMLVSFVLFMFIRVEATWLRYVLRILLIPVVAGISYEFIRLAGNTENKIVNFLSRPGLWMQGLTTREPDDSMIEVAIASVEAVFDWKAYQEKEGIAKYRKDSFGRIEKKEQPNNESGAKGSVPGKSPIMPGAASGNAGRSEKPVSAAPKDNKAERPSSGKRPEARTAAVNRKKENSPAAGNVRKEERPVAGSIRKDEKPVPKSIRKEEGSAGRSSGKTETPIARVGIKEDRPVARIGGAEKAMPKSGTKTIKPLGKAESKPEKAAVKSGSQGEKPAAKIAAKGVKPAGKDNREMQAVPKTMKKDSKPVVQNKGQKMPGQDEKAAELQKSAVSAEVAQEAGEIAANVEIVREIAVSEETTMETQKSVASENVAAEAQENAVGEAAVEETQGNAVREEVAMEAQESVTSEKAVMETQENAEVAVGEQKISAEEVVTEKPQEAEANEADKNQTGKTQNKSKNKEQDRRKNNLISFMSMPDDEEDDEILRALDRYFVYGEDGSEENH